MGNLLAQEHMKSTTAERHLTISDLAEREGVAVQTVKSWRVQGYGPKAFKINNKFVRFRLADVIEWENSLMEDN